MDLKAYGGIILQLEVNNIVWKAIFKNCFDLFFLSPQGEVRRPRYPRN
jgi:hypothetical protein